MKRIARRTGPLVLAALLFPTVVLAQGLRIAPGIGMYAPVSELGQIQGPAGLVEFGKKESTLAFGLSLDFGAADRLVGFRVGAAFAGRSDVPIKGVGCTSCDLRSTLLTAAADLVFRPIPGMPVVRPYALLGAGAKWYNFDSDTFTSDLVEDQAKFIGHFGIGALLFPGGAIGLFAELTDSVSGFEFADGDGDLQHDLLFMVGLSLALGR
jgi:hypothetical protein